MKNRLAITFIAISLITLAAPEACDKCVRKENCSYFGNLTREAQVIWQGKHSCSPPATNQLGKYFGFSPVAKGDYVCCSNAVWGTSGNTEQINSNSAKNPSVGSRHADYNTNFGNQNNYDGQNQNNGYDYPNSGTPNSYDYENSSPTDNNGYGSSPDYNNDSYNNPGNSNPYNANEGNPGYGYNDPNSQYDPKNYFNVNNNPYQTSSPYYPGNKPGNNGNINQGGQCPITSFPPSPETGCCGREASDTDRIIGHHPRPSNYGRHRVPYQPSGGSYWPNWMSNYPNLSMQRNRVARSVDGQVNVTIDDRIAGGRETEFEQFPWTVLLKVTFDYGNNKKQAFNCGGSLISSTYVLTAGHCVYDKGGTVVDIDVYLAEYDKRTFPKDCKNVLGHGQKCITNIVMKADEFTLHPQYEDEQLKNDIALIKLRGTAPYTNYIRPICLPSIDIDTPKFSNLRLAVAGWGRNGRYRSDIKQSTIVNLVPQEKCTKFYTGLTRRNLCAAGYTGEDTCKGDSGGPLMTMYGGKYEVVGIVSGKRADSPCGTSVPSLYVNVYHYNDWIRNNIKN